MFATSVAALVLMVCVCVCVCLADWRKCTEMCTPLEDALSCGQYPSCITPRVCICHYYMYMCILVFQS